MKISKRKTIIISLKSFLLSLFFLLGLLLCLSLFPSCEKGTEPAEIKPGRSDYTWSIDTLKSPNNFFYMFRLWGETPKNIWAIGHADETIASFWHYDGKTWEMHNQRLSSNLQSIHGFDSTNIWACDSPGGNIFHYNGMRWNKIGFFPYPDYTHTLFSDIWGASPDEIYIAGFADDIEKETKAILIKYDGYNWKYIDIPEQKWGFMAIRKNTKNNLLYITAVDFNQVDDKYKIFTYDGVKLEEIYSGKEVVSVNEMQGEIYLCIGQKIYKHRNNKLFLWQDFSDSFHAGTVYGRNEKDIFTKGRNGHLMHYNGADIKTLYETNMPIFDIAVFEKDIFVLCLGDSPIVIHGKLD